MTSVPAPISSVIIGSLPIRRCFSGRRARPGGLGEIALSTDALDQAAALLEESLRIRRQIGQKWGIAATLGSLAWLALRREDLVQAAQLPRESLRIRFEIDDRGGIAWCVEKFAEIAWWQGDAGQAVRLYGAAAAIRAPINSAIDPADQVSYTRKIEELRGTLSPDIYHAVWAEGQAMTLEQVRDHLIP